MMTRVTMLSRRLRACVRQRDAAKEAPKHARAENALLREMLDGTELCEQAALFHLAQVCDVYEDEMLHWRARAIQQGRGWLIASVEVPFEDRDTRHNTPAQRERLAWTYQLLLTVVQRIRTEQGA